MRTYDSDDDYRSPKSKRGVKRKAVKKSVSKEKQPAAVPSKPWYVGKERDNLCYTWESKM